MSRKRQNVPRTPQSVRGGIRAQTTLGGGPRSWWGRRWFELLEAFRLGARLGRGRSYAAAGQVSALTVAPGLVTAHVQGVADTPYRSEIRCRRLEGEPLARLVARLREQPMWVARLLIGDLPAEVETLFATAGCPLFPAREHDVTSRCSCPDWANPCKHLAAVYYLMGESVARQPLLLLELRGVRREDLVATACPAAAAPPPPAAAGRAAAPRRPPGDARAPNPAAADGGAFYGAPLPEFEDFGPPSRAAVAAPLIQRLGPLPFWRGQERFADTLEHLYARAATRGWTVWGGEPLDLRREDERVVIRGANLHLRHPRMRVDTSWR